MTAPDVADDTHHSVDVVVRTPAGASRDFAFRLDELGAAAAATAIAYFVKHEEIQPGDYVLELVRDAVPTPIADTARLADYGLRDGDQLHLIPAKPQVDG